MKNSIKSPISVFIELLEVLVSITLSTFIPVLDVLLNVIESIIKVFNNDSKILFKTALFIKNKAKELAKISFLIYYLILLFSEFGLLLNILQGYIEYTKFEILFLYTFFIITASVILINLMRKKDNKPNYNYIIYIQILFLLPIITVYWITSIEGRTIYLKDLNADQWISLFNTMTIYFSGCLIGLVGFYNKNNKIKKETI